MSRSRKPHSARASDGQATNSPGDARASRLRALPSVEDLRIRVESWYGARDQRSPASSTIVTLGRSVLARARAGVLAGGDAPDQATLTSEILADLASRSRPRLRAVINAGGAILNTNLGRAPLSQRAITRVTEVARGYSNLELDLDTGERGSRQTHIRDLIRALTGAEDAIAVNNNAAATLLTLAALATGREVIVSRGELVEIGGGFRVPDILAQSGARMVEVGATNRVRLSDYTAAITQDTALILSVHPSNFRITGFTAAPTLASLAALTHERHLPLIRDLGSGALLDTATWGLAHEDTVNDTLRAGVDAVCFSGDKLLGGPQAGVIAGKHTLIERIERHPLARAVRCDKLTLAALEATLQSYAEDAAVDDIPIWRAIATPLSALEERATAWVKALGSLGVHADVIHGETAIGGGSLPGETLPTALCAISLNTMATGLDTESLAWRLRTGNPAVLPRVIRNQILLDPRTVLPSEDSALLDAVMLAWNAGSLAHDNHDNDDPA